MSPVRIAVGSFLALLMAVWIHPVLTARYDAPNPPLRHAEPLEAIVADLERFIPEQLESSGIPGLPIALVREGRVVWAAGFGAQIVSPVRR